ncbi:2-dehydro-3-deoxygluconokinase [Nymphon striatum]|nr:2-dehydro-3-deoxygluconokinase [Nymphon striatum]
MKSLLGIGECMLELSSVHDNLWQQNFAGDVFNTLWYAKAIAADSKSINFFTAIGDDQSSEEMINFIKSSGVACSDIPRIKNGVPGLYRIHLDGAERSFSYWRDSSAAKQFMRNPELLWSQVNKADIVYLSGITMAILPDDDAEALIDGLRSALKPGAIIAFDPNIRPRLWASEERMKDIITRTAEISDLVLPSFEDEQKTFNDESPLETAKRYQSLGVKQIVVKDAENETLFVEGDRKEYFPVKQVEGIIDTTAAGDSFNGAYFAEYMESGDISKAISLAQKCAGTVICEKGALIPFETIRTNIL